MVHEIAQIALDHSLDVLIFFLSFFLFKHVTRRQVEDFEGPSAVCLSKYYNST